MRSILLCIHDSNLPAAGRKDCARNKVIWYLNFIARAHILIAQNKLDDADGMLQGLIEDATAGDRVYVIIEMRWWRVLSFVLKADTARRAGGVEKMGRDRRCHLTASLVNSHDGRHLKGVTRPQFYKKRE